MLFGKKGHNGTDYPVIRLNQVELAYVHTYRYLGLLLNVTVSLTEQAKQTLFNVTQKISTLVHIRHYVNCQTALLIYKSNILPLFEYANICFYLLPRQYTNKFQRVQNRALRVIFDKDSDLTLNELQNKAKLAPLMLRAHKQLLCLTYRRLTRPDQYPLIEQTNILTRSVTKIKFHRPIPRIEKYKRFPFYKGVTLWDHLPVDLQHIDSYPLFKSKVTEWLLAQNYIT